MIPIDSPKVPKIFVLGKDTTNEAVVCIDLLPNDQKDAFNHWMLGQTRPTIKGFISTNWAYYHDYERWYGYLE